METLLAEGVKQDGPFASAFPTSFPLSWFHFFFFLIKPHLGFSSSQKYGLAYKINKFKCQLGE